MPESDRGRSAPARRGRWASSARWSALKKSCSGEDFSGWSPKMPVTSLDELTETVARP